MSQKAKYIKDEPRKKESQLQWPLEPGDIGAKYLALRDLSQIDADELTAARKRAHAEGPIAQVLAKMEKDGYWVQPGAGYYPKYTGTVWSIILLAQLGAAIKMDKRLATACSYVLEHTLTKDGHFAVNGLPSGTIDCLQGNLCAALLDLGSKDPRLDKAFEWMARSVTGDGIAPVGDKAAAVRYYSAKCGPGFACGGNSKLPCAWGAVKVMLAFSKLSKEKRALFVNKAINTGVDFLFSADPSNNPKGRVPRALPVGE